MNIYVARQPILDSDYNVLAYKLLYRDGTEKVIEDRLSDNLATSMLLMNSYLNFGIENLVGDSKAFIEFDKNLVELGVGELLDKDRVVIELLDDISASPKVLKKLERLHRNGYSLVCTYSDGLNNKIADLCSVIRVDLKNNSREKIASVISKLKSYKKVLFVSGVDNKKDFTWAKDQGFVFYQGLFFSKPSLEKRKVLTDSALQYVRLMNELNTPEPDFKSLANIILTDVSLTYKLLRLVNSNAKLHCEVKSIQQAIALLGAREFEQWFSLAMVQNMSSKETNEAVKYGMIRSNLLKEIAINSDLKKASEELSLLGTLSIIDTVLEMDMSDALESIPISKEMKATLLGEKTKFSDAMSLCYAYERGVFEDTDECATNIHYELTQLPDHYVQSVSWAEKIFKELQDELKN